MPDLTFGFTVDRVPDETDIAAIRSELRNAYPGIEDISVQVEEEFGLTPEDAAISIIISLVTSIAANFIQDLSHHIVKALCDRKINAKPAHEKPPQGADIDPTPETKVLETQAEPKKS